MTKTAKNQDNNWLSRKRLAKRFSLHNDRSDYTQIDEAIRNGVELIGATPWILVFAILIACIGLNVNSTAVIIGAMLISPLMGPIMGIGYAIGIYDFALLKKSFLNLGIATLISFLTSSLYFLLTPLSEAQSEILARTSPTLWDVLIAISGGLAGMIGATRKEKTNVIPGVAIATALMPPLCTAGYGFAQGNWKFFFGAFYLFSINVVFIALSTVVIVGLLRMPHQTSIESAIKSRMRHALLIIGSITAIPSMFLAYDLVQGEIFKNKAKAFIRNEFLGISGTHISQLNVDPRKKQIELSLIGAIVEPQFIDQLEQKFEASDLAGSKVIVHQGVDNRVDVGSLKQELLQDLYQGTLVSIEQKDKKIRELETQLATAQQQEILGQDVLAELKAQYPEFVEVTFGQGIKTGLQSSDATARVHLLRVASSKAVSKQDREKIERWFRARCKDSNAEVAVEQKIFKRKI
jgi:uncharacterized hydrophobic protein (TIGR00271 family)